MTTVTPPSPPATVASPPPLSPGGRTALRGALVVAASVLLLGSIIGLGATAWALSAVRVVTDEKILPKDMQALIIDTGAVPAAVRLTTDREAAEPRVSMRIINAPRAGAQALVMSQDAGGTRLSVSGEGSQFMDWGRVGEITVTLPPALARTLSVTVHQNDGMLLAQADLRRLVVRNTDGAIVLSGAAKSIDVHTDDGRIVAREPISVTESFTARAVDGDVAVVFRDTAPRTIDVTTVDGDIAVSLPAPGPYLVRASADTARVRVPETNDLSRAASEVTLRSTDGDITVDTDGRR